MPSLSRSRIDKAGSQLRRLDLDSPSAADLEAVGIADDFRRNHREPLEEVCQLLASMAPEFDSGLEIAQRLKQLDSLVAKLVRETTRLSQMEDIGGCRVVLSETALVYEMESSLKERLDIRSDDDYIASPKRDTGYRARHLVALQNGFRIEIQLRTTLQNEWADLVEACTVPGIADIKHGEGPVQVVEFFKQLASFYADLEPPRGEQSVPPSLTEIKALLEVVSPSLRKLAMQKKTFMRLRSRLGDRSR